MIPAAAGLVTLACTFGGVLVGRVIRKSLPRDHVSDDSRDTIKLGIALVATMTALVLGLVTASAKSSFDAVDSVVKQAAAQLLSLDRLLARYGPETALIREALKATVADRVDAIWSPDPSRPARYDPLSVAQGVERLAAQTRRLAPQTEEQRRLQSRAVELAESLLEARWLVFGSRFGHSRVLSGHPPVLARDHVRVLRHARTAQCHGCLDPVGCALSVSAAVFLILEMDGPFDGFIVVSPEPLKYALAHLNR